MIIDRSNDTSNIKNVARYDVVDKFVYLGSLITKDGDCSEGIKRILVMARLAATKLKKIWRDQTITKTVKIMLANSLIFSIAVYSAESWTLKKREWKRIETFELWLHTRILRVSWVEHRTNASVLQELKIKKTSANPNQWSISQLLWPHNWKNRWDGKPCGRGKRWGIKT